MIPHDRARDFSTFFLKLKQNLLENEIKSSGSHPATWEKKGSELITTRNIVRYPAVRDALFRLLRELQRRQGHIIYYGRVKYLAPDECKSHGLYTTVLSHTIRSVDSYCCRRKELFMMILDQHSDRIRLLEAATKTMFGAESPARCLIEPPFQVESHLYQTIQAADWIATLVGRIQAFRAKPEEYAAWEWAEKYYGEAVDRLATDSRMWRPKEVQASLPLEKPPIKIFTPPHLPVAKAAPNTPQ